MRTLDLATLKAPEGARKRNKRVGCGEGSGHGKTSCRGGKGQTARTGGGVRPGFEGGQMPFYRRIPKLGFRSQGKVLGTTSWAVVNLSVLETFDAGSVVDVAALKTKGYVADVRHHQGVKVLGTGEFTKKLTVKVHAISASARQKIEAAGGVVELLS